MRSIAVSAICLLLGVPLVSAQGGYGGYGGGVPPPHLDVPEPPQWEDVEHPEFEPYPVESGELLDNAIFDQFSGSEEEVFKTWTRSKALRNGEEPYTGEWAIEDPEKFKGFNNDYALVLKSARKAAAIARTIDPAIDVSSTPTSWVVQYEVKMDNKVQCAGAYLKLLPPPPSNESDWSSFSNDTPYLIMFGPDKCGATDKVHFIIRRNGTEHHFVEAPRVSNTLLSTLYTLIVNADQTFEIRVDGYVKRSGSLLNSQQFEPPLAPPAEIDDPEDTKPEDWVEDEYIPDPEQAEKPEDWDEDEPYLIPDPESHKPENWREDLPLFVPDPEVEKPAYWDDEEDGEWTAPEIVNPECVDFDSSKGEGCGEWKPPMVRNPKFKGQWTQPLIENPDYVGEWKPRKIPNPDYHPESTFPGQLDANFGGIGFELLSMQSGISFDNIYVGTSVRDAENIGNATWSPKYAIQTESEKRAVEAYRQRNIEQNKKLNSEKSILDRYRREVEDFKLDPRGYCADTYNAFIDAFRLDKVEAVKEFPVTFVVVAVLLLFVTTVSFGLLNVIMHLLTGKHVRKPTKSKRSAPTGDAPTSDAPTSETATSETSTASSAASTAATSAASAAEIRNRKD